MKIQHKNFNLVKGDTLSFCISFENARVTDMNFFATDTDMKSCIELRIGHGIEHLDNKYEIKIDSIESESLKAEPYYYQLIAVFDTGIQTVMEGKINVKEAVKCSATK